MSILQIHYSTRKSIATFHILSMTKVKVKNVLLLIQYEPEQYLHLLKVFEEHDSTTVFRHF